uniref:Venom polypeptide n=1 Tax=Dolopus genitalis TaxID=2488630 RepID=A0A3G5BII9_DOLGE|nr:venom polypeptide [Dolopus genitalis]
MKLAVLSVLLVAGSLSFPEKNFLYKSGGNTFVEFSLQKRIFDGIKAHPHYFPYMASLHIRFSDKDGNERGGGFCGGSLISERFILTAGHCLIGASRVKVWLGAHDLSKETEEGRVEIHVQKEGIFVYEGYDPRKFIHDIAIIKLPEAVKLTREIQIVRLADRSFNSANDIAIISGWGNNGNSQGSDILRYAQLRILPDEVCKNFFTIFYHPTNICIAGKGKSSCSGDSGGPAVVVDRKDRAFTQIGVVSYGSPWGCEKGHPTAYAKVTAFLDWIHEITGIAIRD